MFLHLMTLFSFLGLVTACTQTPSINAWNKTGAERELYSLTGEEHQVHFKALFRSTATRLEDIDVNYVTPKIQETTTFLFGPLTYHSLGGAQKGEKITPHLDQAYLEEGRVMVPYSYEATWMIQKSAREAGFLRLPLPYSVRDLRTPRWQNCTDSEEDHRTWSFFWYFWEPRRPGCDHRLNVHYQEVDVILDTATPQTSLSFPEYARMIRNIDGVPTLSMSFAFGYVEDSPTPDPFKDQDYGARQFQRFYRDAQKQLVSMGFTESPILQSEITYGTQAIGAKFVGTQNGVRMEVSILAAADVDQMDLFAHSYARRHDGFFAWFGHSRVGSGFDAAIFAAKLRRYPNIYSLTSDYQLVYWAGCNSYSYYTLPFFELKAALNPELDPHGTRNLDLISNTLPSLFAFNAANAQVLLQALLNWEKPTSYQEILREIEKTASSWGTDVIVNVLGDEDNGGL